MPKYFTGSPVTSMRILFWEACGERRLMISPRQFIKIHVLLLELYRFLVKFRQFDNIFHKGDQPPCLFIDPLGKKRISCGRTMPFFMISAYPDIDVRGVFSSWETLAENSLRILDTASSPYSACPLPPETESVRRMSHYPADVPDPGHRSALPDVWSAILP